MNLADTIALEYLRGGKSIHIPAKHESRLSRHLTEAEQARLRRHVGGINPNSGPWQQMWLESA
jgi:hypothetical protein